MPRAIRKAARSAAKALRPGLRKALQKARPAKRQSLKSRLQKAKPAPRGRLPKGSRQPARKGLTRDNRITNRRVRQGKLPKSQREIFPQKKTTRRKIRRP